MGRKYIKCPRCELNYILEGEDYCTICKSEMKHHAEGEDDGLLDNFDDMELCPVCGVNYIKEGQAMCDECKKKKNSGGSDDSGDKDWNKSDDDDDEDDIESIRSDIDGDMQEDDEPYNSGFEEVDMNADPYKVDDDPLIDDDLDTPIEFSSDLDDEEDEDENNQKSNSNDDDFEVVEADESDDDEDEEDSDLDDDDYDDGDLLGKKK